MGTNKAKLKISFMIMMLALFSPSYGSNSSFSHDGFSLVNDSNQEIALQFDVGYYEIIETGYNCDGYGSILSTGGMENLKGELDKPISPFFSVIVEVPFGKTVALSDVSSSDEVFTDVGLGTPLLSVSYNMQGEINDTRDNYTYGLNSFYPSSNSYVSEVFEVNGNYYVWFSYRPFSYNPITKELKVSTTANITLEYVTNADNVTPLDIGRCTTFPEWPINYSTSSLVPTEAPLGNGELQKFMLVVPPSDSDYLGWTYARYRLQTGYDVKVHNTQNFNETWENFNGFGKIRQAIEDYNADYVLMYGDYDERLKDGDGFSSDWTLSIPRIHIDKGGLLDEYTSYVFSDQFYTHSNYDIDINWQDGWWTPHSFVGRTDYCIGRLPYDSSTDRTSYLSQIKAYESQEVGRNYDRELHVVGAGKGYGKRRGNLRFYFETMPGPPDNMWEAYLGWSHHYLSQLENKLSDYGDMGLFIYVGHGSQSGLAIGQTENDGPITRFLNFDEFTTYPIGFSFACLSGRFTAFANTDGSDGEENKDECVAQYMILPDSNEDVMHGCVSMFAAQEKSENSNVIQYTMATYEQYQNRSRGWNLGDLIAEIKARRFFNYTGLWPWYEYFDYLAMYNFNLLGDPALMLPVGTGRKAELVFNRDYTDTDDDGYIDGLKLCRWSGRSNCC